VHRPRFEHITTALECPETVPFNISGQTTWYSEFAEEVFKIKIPDLNRNYLAVM
jgi:hypothetical protein